MTTINTNNTASLNLTGNTTTVKQQKQTPIGQTQLNANTKTVAEHHQQQQQSQQQSAISNSDSNTPNNLIASSLKPVNSGIPKPSLHPSSILKSGLSSFQNQKSYVPVPSHSYSSHMNDFNIGPSSHHLTNLKYPPEVPKLGYHLSDPFAHHNLTSTKNIPPYRPPPTGRSHQIRLPPSAIQHHHPPLPPVPSTSIHRLTPHSQQQQQQQQHQQQQQSQHQLNDSNSDIIVQPPPPTRLTANHLQQAQQVHNNHGQEMLKFVRKADSDTSSATTSSNSGRLSVEQPTKHIQTLLSELRLLKETNQRLSDDNQELRDLCCFLDDDRQKGRKLAREWQRFGRYTASVMRQEVSAYQNKLRQLDDKQQELIRDNLELKELCLYLDEERSNAIRNATCSNCGGSVNNSTNNVPLRDDGDGSSSGTNADENISMNSHFARTLQDLSSSRNTLSDQTLHYVRSLESRIRELEQGQQSGKLSSTNSNSDPILGRPEAVVRALQVLEVREQLESEKPINNNDNSSDQLDDKEKALLREMCNVVWRKLEETPEGKMNHV
uniref:CSON000528 protein n=1 Tax=Culicoides sonorensis TaxID=179676 RepID=A0A336KWF1_CULSO